MPLFSSFMKHIKTAKTDENGNSVSIGKNVNLDYQISGKNNKIVIKSMTNPSTLKIVVYGDGNNIFIDAAKSLSDLKILVGSDNTNKVNNSKLTIGQNFYCEASQILIYDNNSDVNIGKDNLWSCDVTVHSGDTIIGNHVCIGQNVTIMSNARIPNNCIVGTFSVVSQQFVKDHVLIAGNPAQVRTEL